MNKLLKIKDSKEGRLSLIKVLRLTILFPPSLISCYLYQEFSSPGHKYTLRTKYCLFAIILIYLKFT